MLPFWHKKCLVDNTLVHTSRQVQAKIYFQLLFCIVWKTFVGWDYQQFRFDHDRSRLPIKRFYFVFNHSGIVKIVYEFVSAGNLFNLISIYWFLWSMCYWIKGLYGRMTQQRTDRKRKMTLLHLFEVFIKVVYPSGKLQKTTEQENGDKW